MSGADAFAERFDVSRETLRQFEQYAMLLLRWNTRINLVGAATLPTIWHRHFTDSAQIVDHAPVSAASWADLGSGAGFPGLVAAVLLAARGRATRVTLVESDSRKAAFLSTAAREMKVAVEILPERIESLGDRRFDVISARALAPLPRLLELAAPRLAPGGVCLFLKGARLDSELTAASKAWHYVADPVPSATDPTATLLRLTEVRRA